MAAVFAARLRRDHDPAWLGHLVVTLTAIAALDEDRTLDDPPGKARYRRSDAKKALPAKYLSQLLKLRASLDREILCREERDMQLAEVRHALASAHAALAELDATVQQVQRLARHDSLTQLPNRAYFCERLDALVASAKEHHQVLTVLFIDLNDFKGVNDAHGHPIGDALLRIVGARLRQGVRSEDVVGRLGGDEFACVLSGVGALDQARTLAAKLNDSISMPAKIYSLSIQVRMSVGIALYPRDGEDAGALLQHADAAMYRAKRLQCGIA